MSHSYSAHRSIPLAILVLTTALLASGWAEASNRKTLAGSRPAQPASRSTSPVDIAGTTAPGQAGYVHFFLIRDLREEISETQIAIELDDQRIAWSFPEIGVATITFITSGTVEANGRLYQVEHLYGVRPFRDERSMRELREQLAGRIAPYIEDETPYCYVRARGEPLCLSCLDFVVRVLFPGHFPAFPNLPRDFQRGGFAAAHTTDDLLLYLLGLHGLPSRAARLKRVERLGLPHHLREDVLHLVETMEPDAVANSGRGNANASKNRRGAEPSGTPSGQRSVRRKKS